MAGSYFRKSRNIELSTVYYIRTQIDASWTNVTTVKSFKNAYDEDLPVVCVRLNDTLFNRKEIGATTLENRYGIIIDIFATSDGQRLDLADFIENEIKGSWTYYTHSQSGGTLTRTDDSTKVVLQEITQNSKVEISDNPEKQDRFRHIISFIVRQND